MQLDTTSTAERLRFLRDAAPERLKDFLLAKGWTHDDRGLAGGVHLFSHADHPQRQLMVPVARETFDDYAEAVARMFEKLEQMTGERFEDLVAEALPASPPPEAPGKRRFGGLRGLLGLAACAFVTAAVGTAVYGHVTAPAPIALSLAGCIDFRSSQIVERMRNDSAVVRSTPEEFARNFPWLRSRANDASDDAIEMRKCYLTAQLDTPSFDSGGLVNQDITKIEDSLKSLYDGLGAHRLMDTSKPKDMDIAAMALDFKTASDAADRVSLRLGRVLRDFYL